MAQQTFSGVPGAFAAGAVLTAAEQELIRDFMVAQIKEGMTGDTGEILPMIMDLTNNLIELDSGGLKFSDATTQTTAAVAGISWSGSTANGIGTFGSSSSVVAESTATYDGTTLALTQSGGGISLDGLNSSDANTLDDYEEGSFTVAFTAASGTITADTSYDSASYVKIGKLVYFQGYIALSGVSGPSGVLTLTGLPFSSSATGMPELSDYSVNSIIVREAGTTFTGEVYGQVNPGQTTMVINAGGNTTTLIESTAGNIDAGTSFWLGGCYRADT